MTDFRNKNNVSSKKSYEKSVEKQYAYDYEHEMVRHHILTNPNTDAYHWSVIPEEYLYDAGYINDFNKHRLERLMRKKEKKDGENRARDYGFDGLARTCIGNNIIFSGLQAKYYLDRQVCAGDIGSFLAMQISLMIKNPLSKGFLYTTTKLQADLAGNISNPSYPIRHILHPWKHPDARMVSKNSFIQNDCDKKLRKDQIDALKELENKDGINALNTPCRWGKTIVAGHHIKKINAKIVIAIAPLLISVENLQDRLSCFLPEYSSLIVDSDKGGITDVEQIKNFLASEGKRVIYSTFKSSIDILSNIISNTEDIYLLCDEVHNANKELCEFIKQFKRGLVISATLPEEIIDLVDINHIVHISFSQAIKDNIITDYTIWLPHLTTSLDGTTSVDIEIPIEFALYDSNFTAKALYLATVMLRTGSRRCIVYLSSQDDCNKFMEVVSQIFEMYHGLTIWTDKIDSTVSKLKRKEILEAFQKGNDDIFHILTSIRILDEAVDIPRCDSVFITDIGEKSSDIRMMQRCQRSSTKDPKNPSKCNNIILWADGWEKCTGALDLLREGDPEFHKKIRIIDSNYDKSGNIDRVKSIKEEKFEFVKWNSIKCLSYEDKQLLLVRQYIDFVKSNNREPTKIDSERKLFVARNKWLCSFRGYGNIKLYPKSKELLDMELPGWSNTQEDKQHVKIKLLHDFFTKHGRLPVRYHKDKENDTRTESQKEENFFAEILHVLKCGRQSKLGKTIYSASGKLYDSSEKMLNELIPGWYKSKDELLIEKCDMIIQYHKDNGIFPKHDKSTLGNLYNNIRTKIITHNVTSYPYDVIANNLDVYNKDWRRTLNTIKDENIDMIIQFIKDYKRLPRNYYKPANEAEIYEKSLAVKITGYRCYVTGKKSSQTISDYNKERLEAVMPNWLTAKSTDIIKLEKYIQIVNNIKKYTEEYNRLPLLRRRSPEKQYENELVCYIDKFRTYYKNDKLSPEIIDLLNSIPLFSWNKTK